MKKIRKLIFTLIPLGMFITFWEISVYNTTKAKFLFGSPTLVIQSFIESWQDFGIAIDIAVTTAETVTGFIIGNILGVLLGLCLSYNKLLGEISKPYVVALGSIPIFALAPMLIIWFGVGYLAKVVMAVFSTFLVTTVQAYSGAQQLNRDYEKLFLSFGANRSFYYLHAIVPNTLVWVITSLKMTISFALLGAFIGEFISSERGLGHLILKAGGLYNIPKVIVGLIHIIIIALILNYLVGVLEKYLLKWKRLEPIA